MRRNDWVDHVRMVAETDRALKSQFPFWTAKMTAERLNVSRSALSICRKLDEALRHYPKLEECATKTEAYNVLRAMRRTG